MAVTVGGASRLSGKAGTPGRGVTITEQEVVDVVGVHGSAGRELLALIFPVAVATVERYAPAAPSDVANLAVVRMVGHEDLSFPQSTLMKFDKQADRSSIWDPERAAASFRYSGAMGRC
ncbi:MAG: hypothetical protein OXQ31_01095 [Spirochaetaceae bacterium]|nr:hypothetical protein [Spirochaetaceae bacterium]